MARRTPLLGVVSAMWPLALTSCSLTLAPDSALTGGGGDASAGGATDAAIDGPDGTLQQDAVSADGSGEGGAEAGGQPDGGDGGTCTNGAVKCSGQTPQTCTNGGWQPGAPCPYVCSNGACSGSCTPGTAQCNGQQPQTCDSTGTWQSSGPPCTNVCTAGSCAGSCAPGATQCSGNTPQTCNSGGTWQSGSPCPYVCSAGSCTGMCVPGAMQCSGNTPQTCNSSGTWQSGSSCPYVCSAGSCTGVCAPGATRCSAGTPQTCDSSGNWQSGSPVAGCWSWHGSSVGGWTISNLEPKSSTQWDCCGCSPCTACSDNTGTSASGGVATFSSGPEESGGTNHRRDGFTAVYANVPVITGQSHTVTIDVTGLAASIAGVTGGESTTQWYPHWGIDIYAGSTQLANLDEYWATPQCSACSAAAGDLGQKKLVFTPSAATVDLALYADHGSSQCGAEAYDVEVMTDWITVTSP